MSDNKPIEVDSKGIPLKSTYPEKPPVAVLYTLFTIIPGAIGLALAYFTSYYAEEKRATQRQLTSGIVYHVGTTGSKLVYRAIFLCFHARRVRRGTPSRARM